MSQSNSSVTGGLTVLLVVEDDDDYRKVLSETLEEAGYSVESAIHGLDALTRLRSGLKPTVILLDLMMPVMDGWSFVAALKDDTSLASIPVIATTGAGDRVLYSAPVSAAYLNKPINREQLLATINLCISRTRQD